MTTKGDKILAFRLAKLNAFRPKTKYEKELARTRRWNRDKALENLYAQAPRLDEPTQQTTFNQFEKPLDMTHPKTEKPKTQENKQSEVPKWMLERKQAERRPKKK